MKHTIVLFAALTMFCGCNETTQNTSGTNADTAALVKKNDVPPALKEETGWDSVNFYSPVVKYDNISSRDIETREGDRYAIYGVTDRVLFSSGKAELRNDVENTLVEVCKSVNAKFPHNSIRVYGFTDSVGSETANDQLSLQRAIAVRHFFMANCGIDSSLISVKASGENGPVADNGNAAGRMRNRRVLIVVKK